MFKIETAGKTRRTEVKVGLQKRNHGKYLIYYRKGTVKQQQQKTSLKCEYFLASSSLSDVCTDECD